MEGFPLSKSIHHSIFKFVQNLMYALGELHELFDAGIPFLVYEFFEVIVNGLIIVVREDALDYDDHIVVVDEKDDLSISLQLDLCKVSSLLTVKYCLVFYEINHLYKTSLQVLKKLLFASDIAIDKMLKAFVYLELVTLLFQGLNFLLGHLWFFI